MADALLSFFFLLCCIVIAPVIAMVVGIAVVFSIQALYYIIPFVLVVFVVFVLGVSINAMFKK